MEINGTASDRRAAGDLARWCADSVAQARRTGTLDTRLMVQQVDLIVAALQEYANGMESESAVRIGALLAEREQLRDFLQSCRKAMEVATRIVGSVTDWSHMISAIDELAPEDRD